MAVAPLGPRWAGPALWVVLGCAATGCEPFPTILRRNLVALQGAPRALAHRIEHPTRADARLAVLWVGHATMLLQLDDRFVLTDPVFTDTVAQFSPRLTEPGLAPEHLPPIDAVLISHLHFDHLSLGTLDLIEDKVARLLAPTGSLVYIPPYRFATDTVAPWETVDDRGLRITAVPVRHEGFRYGVDAAWMTRSYTAWVIEYHGMSVYFGGDTAYDAALFTAVRARFPALDLALLPIAPVFPRAFAQSHHIDGVEAVQAFRDLGARRLIPMHYDTFAHGADEEGVALRRFQDAVSAAALPAEAVRVLAIGEQAVLIPATRAAASTHGASP